MAAVGVTPYGEMVLMSTTDRDDMTLEHRFRSREGNFTAIADADLDIPKDQRLVGQDILGNGSVYIGQFIRKHDTRGDCNYDHILGVAAWKPTPRQLVHNILHRFSYFQRQDLLDSGMLMRHEPMLWTSKEMVFRAEPQKGWNWRGRRIHKTNAQGEKLYSLSTLIAPRKGWDAAKLYHKNIAAAKSGWLASVSHYVMRRLINSVSDIQYNLTLPQLEARVARTFAPVAKDLRAGRSPFTGFDEDDHAKPEQSRISQLKGKLRKVFTTAVFGLK